MFSSCREFERRRRLRHLLGGLIDLGFLACNLGFEVSHRRFVLTDLRVGLIDRGFVVSCVDGREQIAFFHDLVISDIDADNAAGDLRADQHRPAIDKGVVRTLVVTGVKIPAMPAMRPTTINPRQATIATGCFRNAPLTPLGPCSWVGSVSSGLRSVLSVSLDLLEVSRT